MTVARLDDQAGIRTAAISRGVVHLHRIHFGRGPTRARTHLIPDGVVTVLEDVLTQAERTLITSGRAELVAAMRRKLSEAIEAEFRTVIEVQTGRAVASHMSQVDVDADRALELFVLAPADSALEPQR
jgi:uncharacterized protein YbcI